MMPLSRLFPRLAALVLLACLLPTTRATTVVQPTFDGLVESADYVVRAVVTAVDSEWRQNPKNPSERYIGSRVTLQVKEIIKGQPPQPLVLEIVGGTVGDREFHIEGAPQFSVGDENILFVRNNGRSFFPLVGLMHGYFRVQHNRTSDRDEVTRFDGRPLYSEQELNPAADRQTLRAASALPMTPNAFRDRIQDKQRELLSREKLR